jgi:hypothetical protein
VRLVSLSFPDARGVVASHTDGPALPRRQQMSDAVILTLTVVCLGDDLLLLNALLSNDRRQSSKL